MSDIRTILEQHADQAVAEYHRGYYGPTENNDPGDFDAETALNAYVEERELAIYKDLKRRKWGKYSEAIPFFDACIAELEENKHE